MVYYDMCMMVYDMCMMVYYDMCMVYYDMCMMVYYDMCMVYYDMCMMVYYDMCMMVYYMCMMVYDMCMMVYYDMCMVYYDMCMMVYYDMCMMVYYVYDGVLWHVYGVLYVYDGVLWHVYGVLCSDEGKSELSSNISTETLEHILSATLSEPSLEGVLPSSVSSHIPSPVSTPRGGVASSAGEVASSSYGGGLLSNSRPVEVKVLAKSSSGASLATPTQVTYSSALSPAIDGFQDVLSLARKRPRMEVTPTSSTSLDFPTEQDIDSFLDQIHQWLTFFKFNHNIKKMKTLINTVFTWSWLSYWSFQPFLCIISCSFA